MLYLRQGQYMENTRLYGVQCVLARRLLYQLGNVGTVIIILCTLNILALHQPTLMAVYSRIFALMYLSIILYPSNIVQLRHSLATLLQPILLGTIGSIILFQERTNKELYLEPKKISRVLSYLLSLLRSSVAAQDFYQPGCLKFCPKGRGYVHSKDQKYILFETPSPKSS